MSETLSPRIRSESSSRSIRTAIPIPNLIEVQKRSYERFLQMHTAPADRDRRAAGASSSRSSRSRTSARPARSSSSSTRSATGSASAASCRASSTCAASAVPAAQRLIAPDARGGEVLLRRLRQPDAGHGPRVRAVRRPGGAEVQVRRGRVPGARPDLHRPAEGHDPARGLRQGPRHRGQAASATSRSRRSTSARSRCSPRTGPSSSTGPSASSSASSTAARACSSRPTPTKTTFMAKVIPYRGSWVEFENDQKNILYVRIDRKRKFPATVFLRALGLRGRRGDPARVLHGGWRSASRAASSISASAPAPGRTQGPPRRGRIPRRGDEIVKKGRRIKAEQIDELREAEIEWVPVEPRRAGGRVHGRRRRRPGDRRGAGRGGKPLTEDVDRLQSAGERAV